MASILLKISSLALGLLMSLNLLATDVSKDLSYVQNSSEKRHLLNIYYPKVTTESKDVLIFIHGGSWNSGDKSTYWWLGRNLARKEIVSVLINYSHSPQYKYDEIATDCARAIKWVRDSISRFGGNPKRIFVMGHSAGGQLAALIDADSQYFSKVGIQNPIRGVILNDAFGLDMYDYLSTAVNDQETAGFLKTFSTNKEAWKKGSPFYYIKNVSHPYLFFWGEKTYGSIKSHSSKMASELKNSGKYVEQHVVEGKKHIGMITQLIWPGNGLYPYILDFIKAQK